MIDSDDTMKTVLVSSYFDLFGGAAIGSQQRILQLTDWIGREYEVVRVVTGPFKVDSGALGIGSDLISPTNSRMTRWPHKLGERFSSIRNFLSARSCESQLDRVIKQQGEVVVRERFRDLLVQLDPVAVLFEYAWSMMPLHEIASQIGVPIILDSHDCLSQRTAKARQLGEPITFPFSPELEFATLSKADAVLAIQEEEAACFRAAMPHANVITVPHSAGIFAGLDDNAVVDAQVLLVASESSHNVDSLRCIIQNVWPSVLASCPEATLAVCGTVCNRFLGEAIPSTIKLHGVVESLAPFYRSSQVVLNVPRFGSGLKIKGVEGIRFGKSLVCTPTGAEGMPLDPQCFVVAEFDEVANATISLLKDARLRGSLEANTRAYYDRHFSPTACYTPLKRYLDELREVALVAPA